MGFFHHGKKAKQDVAAGTKLSLSLLHRGECKVCPLNTIKGPHNPHMEPTGSKSPVVYMLGASPNKRGDATGEPFAGRAFKIINQLLPADLEAVRWNNIVRTRTPEEREPSSVEIECCRPSIIRDIEATKPHAIFGFGNVPLHWATGYRGINKWRGRRIPIQVGKHKCWYFPFDSLEEIADKLSSDKFRIKRSGEDQQFILGFDVRRALEQVAANAEPEIVTAKELLADVTWVTGHEPNDGLKVLHFLDTCYNHKFVGFDYETVGLRPYADGAKLLTVALSHDGGTFAFPLHHRMAGWSRIQVEDIERYLGYFLESRIRKVAHKLDFELEWTGHKFGREIINKGRWEDTLSQAFVFDERMNMGKPDAHSLEFLFLNYFGIDLKGISNIDVTKLDDTPLDQVLPYNGLDAKAGLMLFRAQRTRLRDEGLWDVYQHHKKRIPATVLTQLKGVPVSQKVVVGFLEQYHGKCAELLQKLRDTDAARKYRKAKSREFEPTENREVMYVLKSILREDVDKVDEAVLSKIDDPFCKLLLKWREPAKLLSTYVKPMLRDEHKLDGIVYPASPHLFGTNRVHPILSTTRTDTSRTSSEDPNSQNFPKRKNKQLRKQVKARKGHKIVSFDYGQIQARNVGMESLDKALIKSFWERHDIHADWVEWLVREYPEWIKEGPRVLAKDKKLFKGYRDRTKNEFVFPSFFGASSRSVAGYLKIPEEVAERMHDEFWEQFPDVSKWHQRVYDFYAENGYVTGLSGYRRRGPVSPNQMINAPIQADEAKIVLDAMIRLSRTDWEYQPIMEIHDDLTFEWEIGKIEEYAEVVVRAMLNCPFEWAKCVPLVVEMSVGDDWATQEEVDKFASDQWTGMDPNVGAWADGTGWANHAGMEKALRGAA